ncbi:MAG TPA: ECF-type sigma factor [Gemmatimonadaceae bacterium]|nr:ECF-type sigma factor [Gemmatimonadaceae bacterium]
MDHRVDSTEFTPLIAGLRAGDAGALDRAVTLVYEELRRIAHRQLAGEQSGHTLDTGALVHEAYLKLRRLDRMEWRSREHFLAMAARVMRHVLVDYAVARRAAKRGGGSAPVTLDATLLAAAQPGEEILALDEALRRLEALSERQSRVVECRFFAGMSVEETATALELSPATVKRDWVAARAWLNRELSA